MEALNTYLQVEGTKIEDDRSQALCSECKAIFDNWYDRDNWRSAKSGHTHHNILDLRRSALKGCPVCALVLRGLDPEAIQKLLQNRPRFKGLVRVRLKVSKFDGLYAVEILFYVESDKLPIQLEDSWKTTIELFRSGRLGLSQSTKLTPIANSLEVSANSETGKIQKIADCKENWALIKNWLRTCQDKHTNCSQKNIDRQLPTRLIDVGVNGGDLKLFQTKSLPRETQYLTLSHCWGGEVYTTLTSSNFQEFLSHIPAESFTKTFREAVITTRTLGFRYLWIDSLCIIQDDEVDWQHESSKMGTVYTNTALNIAASAAPNGEYGCFLNRTSGQVYGCKVATRERPDSSDITLWDCTIPNFSWELLRNNILNSRAWVFQELYLSPRILYFTAHQLAWECISSKACEIFPDWYNDKSMTRPQHKIIAMADGPRPRYDIAGRWSAVVIDYSAGEVTFSRDKLVALSGVARLFAARYGATYLAGIWKEDLVRQLTWQTLKASGIDTRSSVPSWSWASINTKASYLGNLSLQPGYIPLVSIVEATTVVWNDTFGDVKEGRIRMRCRLPCIATLIRQGKSPWFTLRSGSRQFPCMLRPDRVQCSVGDELYLLALLCGTDREDDELLCGLVIEPVEPASYRRTGLFTLTEEDVQDFMAAQDEATSQNKYFVGEVLGPDENGHEMCIITLV
jgi:hypothetical protein